MDINRYRDLKKKLPYVVCGMFHPLIRRKENFSAIQYFIIDMDHIVEHGKSITTITDKLRAEPQVHLFFKSPGGDGIKVMFKLKENCHDAQLFSAFYKIFGHYFSLDTLSSISIFAFDHSVEYLSLSKTRLALSTIPASLISFKNALTNLAFS